MDCRPGQPHHRARLRPVRRSGWRRRASAWAGLGLALLVLGDRTAVYAQSEAPASDASPAVEVIVFDQDEAAPEPTIAGGSPAHGRVDAGNDALAAPQDAHGTQAGSEAVYAAVVDDTAESVEPAAAPDSRDNAARSADPGNEESDHSASSVSPAPADGPAGSEEARLGSDKRAAPAAWELLDPPYGQPSRLPVSGKAMYYNPGVMDIVIDSRLKFDHIEPCDECVGYVAMLRFGDVNRKVWLQIDEWRVEGPFHVVDAAATKHVGMLLERGWIVDVDYRTAARWNFRMPYVTVWERPPRNLLLATDTVPLAWNRSLPPAEVFTPLPRSISLPDSALENQALLVKEAINRRHLGRDSFVDVLLEAPDELHVK